MNNNYPATLPNGIDQRDVATAALAALPSQPDGVWFKNNQIVVGYATSTLTAGQQTAYQNAVAAATNDPNAPWRVGPAADARLNGAVVTLRQWASDARSTTVTSGNAVAVLQTVVTRLGTFFDNFADLLQSQGRS